ncbi:hypothetical protein GOBAR_AA26848 [Gossypium barbadense]|uniref:Uncharacterized protein n=1 Tax=Gossypium barbadense TaxID=3634 RepID=A0A2P5WRW5_GOSBA|nr:hypothetical protein GOBAR_AA26848 [Gossypium barbadense]
MMRLEKDIPVVVEVGFHNYSVQRRGYRGGRVGHGSRGEPFPVELQVPNYGELSAKTMMRLEKDIPVVVEVGFHNYSVQRRGYRGGRVGHGSRGEPFPVELQVPK